MNPESYTGMNPHQNAQGTVQPVCWQSKLSSHAFMCAVILGPTWSGVIVESSNNALWHAARLCICAYYTSDDVHVEVSARSAVLSQLCTHQNTAWGSG